MKVYRVLSWYENTVNCHVHYSFIINRQPGLVFSSVNEDADMLQTDRLAEKPRGRV